MRRAPSILYGLSLSLLLAGCRVHSPVRWPGSDLWRSTREEAPRVPWPEESFDPYPIVASVEGMTVGVDVLDADRAYQMFGADVVRHGFRPALFAIHNGTEATYLFQTTRLEPSAIPAKRVAQVLAVHPALKIARMVRWIIGVLPSAVFRSLIEPMTGIDFPVMEDVGRRPSASADRRLQQEVITHELSDEPIRPSTTRTGVVFLNARAPLLTLRVTLVEATSRRPLTLVIPLPQTRVVRAQVYQGPAEEVWTATLDAAHHVPAWTLAPDPRRHTITVMRHRFFWRNTRHLLVSVQPLSPHRTRVTVEGPAWSSTNTQRKRRRSSQRIGEESATVQPRLKRGEDIFFDRLDQALVSAIEVTAPVLADPASPPTKR